ncbi:hypothetical protein IQ238_20745 [Pleurocapsales cyanobacterium LEGE 06147]|nr:hypothetical protein [Pleurocapsales cyanobacterium LEGE 06147]
MMVQQPATAKPPHHLSLELGIIIFTRIASHIYDLSLQSREGKFYFLGRIEQKSGTLWAVTYIGCQPCMPDYFDDWQQAALFLIEFEVSAFLPFDFP